jgi:hypothetical protein
MTRFWIPALVVLLYGVLVTDVAGTGSATPARQETPGAREPATAEPSEPAEPTEPLRVSAAVAGNEFDMTMMLADALPDGASPGPDADCQDAYAWLKDRGALLVNGLRLRVDIAASRYTQVVFQSASLRVTGAPELHLDGGATEMYSCGDAGSLPYPGDEDAQSKFEGPGQAESGLWTMPALAIPTDPPDEFGPPSSGGEQYAFDLMAQDTASFTFDVTVPGFGEPTDFVVDLRMRVNGADRTFVVRDGDEPFTLLPDPGGAGFRPDWYHWCPGSPGNLTFVPGEALTLDSLDC